MPANYSVTKALIDWLLDLGFDAHANVPGSIPSYGTVTVERTGGYVADLVDHAEMAVQCWGETDLAAATLADDVRNYLLTHYSNYRPRPVGTYAISVSAGPYRFYDEATRRPRYQLVLDVTCQLITMPI